MAANGPHLTFSHTSTNQARLMAIGENLSYSFAVPCSLLPTSKVQVAVKARYYGAGSASTLLFRYGGDAYDVAGTQFGSSFPSLGGVDPVLPDFSVVIDNPGDTFFKMTHDCAANAVYNCGHNFSLVVSPAW